MNYTKVIRRETKVMALVVAVLVILVTGASYAMFMRVNSGQNNQVVKTGDLRILYESTNGYINGNTYPEIMPLTNTEGLAQTGYNFSVENVGSLNATYAVYLYVDQAGYVSDNPNGALFDDVNSIKLNLQKNSDGNTNVTTLGNQYKKEESGIDKYELYAGDLNPNVKDTFKLKIWLDEKVDVEHIGKYVYLKLEVQGNVTGQRELSNARKVTFDANGGTVSLNQKSVVAGENYGELPTPTRDGYTFKGWNGKNKLNIDVSESSPSNTERDNTTKRTFTSNTYVRGLAYNNYYRYLEVSSVALTSNTINMITSSGYGIGFPLDNFSNRSYSLSYTADHTGKARSSIMFYAQDGTLLDYTVTTADGNTKVVFSVPANTYYLVIDFSASGINTNVTITNVQLEEGEEATEYEPYYVTSSTEVTQDKDHTLTAIWEANS